MRESSGDLLSEYSRNTIPAAILGKSLRRYRQSTTRQVNKLPSITFQRALIAECLRTDGNHTILYRERCFRLFRADGGRFDVYTSECKHKLLASHVMICSYS